MKVLIDIGHPAHVHYFKNFIKHFIKSGSEVVVVARDREFINDLLESYKIPYVSRGKGRGSKIGKLIYMFIADLTILKVSLKFKPDVFLSFSSPYAAQVAYLVKKPHIAITDTEHEDNILKRLTFPFSNYILTPFCYLNDLGDKQIRFNSVVENFYLNENFQKPNLKIKEELGIKENENYIFMRFVSWEAHHDFGHKGLDEQSIIKLIELFSDNFKILISSENKLPEKLSFYSINIAPHKIHDVLASASLFIGESATMASESAMLGTYAVYINSLPLMGYLKYEEDSGMLKHFMTSKGVVEYVSKILENEELKKDSIRKSRAMQESFINPSKLLIWLIENYPNSFHQLKINNDFQKVFK